MKLKLIPNWKRSWKFSSVWYAGLGFLVSVADWVLQIFPIGSIHGIPHGRSLLIILLGLTLIGRITHFGEKENDSEEAE